MKKTKPDTAKPSPDRFDCATLWDLSQPTFLARLAEHYGPYLALHEFTKLAVKLGMHRDRFNQAMDVLFAITKLQQ